MKIYEINVAAMFDENFLSEIKKNPKILAKLAGIPEEVIENIDIKIPSQPSAEFRKLILEISSKAAKEGIIGQEKFESIIASAENFMDAVYSVNVELYVNVYNAVTVATTAIVVAAVLAAAAVAVLAFIL